MTKDLTWDDAMDIGILLSESIPNSIRWRCGLPICTTT